VIASFPSRSQRWRLFKDRVARRAVAAGGIGVIAAIVLIFFYLVYVVSPLLRPAEAEPLGRYPVPGEGGATLHLAMEEQAEIAVRFAASGEVTFFATASGLAIRSERLPLPPGASITALAAGRPEGGIVAAGLSNGQVILVRHAYQVSFPDDQRQISPLLEYPLGVEPIDLDPAGEPIRVLAVQSGEETTLVGYTRDGRLPLLHVAAEESFIGAGRTLERTAGELPLALESVSRLVLDPEQRILYANDGGERLAHYDLSDKAAPALVEQLAVAEPGARITVLEPLAGGVSLIIGDASGRITQWFPVRDPNQRPALTAVRDFDTTGAPVVAIAPEFARKGFLAVDARGVLGIYHATARRTLLHKPLSDGPVDALAVSPRADALLALDRQGEMHFWKLRNEHPEVSWSSLWEEVWYESYEEPRFIWQSSAATNDFEPKFSITPLAFGTLKAAFYAMLIAMPLAILGAIYTAYFMAPSMRRLVKPTVEIMEALPTVILGFLAGLWLAPLVEDHLPGVFALLTLLPLGVLLTAYGWHRLAPRLRIVVPPGWEAALLIVPIGLIGWASMALSQPLETTLFGGDIRGWLTNELGMGFDQRNALVVGLAMGFAVIPTIFSIAEDAIFSVPKHLSFGSLALGATPWQTLVRVVLLTASPGIFSAVMIGLGRAVGETMIVLMATGNTPVMDFSIFQGMRTLAANIAVEMPESEVGSTHYRILFLTALVLFLFTFALNTLAEVVRQRLRRKYSSL
jgi:phosphate transport system permease protein